MNCVHGIDARFCAVCNKKSKAAVVARPAVSISTTTLEEILRFLNAVELRATSATVAEVLGVPAVALSARLGARRRLVGAQADA